MVQKDVNIRLDGEMGALLRQRGVRSVNRWVNDLVAGHLGAGLAEEAMPAVGKNGLALTASEGTEQAWFVYGGGLFSLGRVVKSDSKQIWFDSLDTDLTWAEDVWSWSPMSVKREEINAFVKAPQDGREAVEALKSFLREHGVFDILATPLGVKLCREMNMLPSRDSLALLLMEPCGGDDRHLSWLSEEGSNLEGRLIYADIVVTRKPGFNLDIGLQGSLDVRIGGGGSLLPREMSRSRTRKLEPSWRMEAGATHAVIDQGTRLIGHPLLLWPNRAELVLYEDNRLHAGVDVTCKLYLQSSRPKTKPSPPFTGHGTDFTKPLSAAR